MFVAAPIAASTKTDAYAELAAQARALLQGERDRTANAANFAALVYHALPGLNWCGFYFWDGRELVVGPFQGKPACVRIALGKGVCGTAAATRATQVVAVVPVVAADGALIGVWDVDSPELARFDHDDRAGMEALVRVFLEALHA